MYGYIFAIVNKNCDYHKKCYSVWMFSIEDEN